MGIYVNGWDLYHTNIRRRGAIFEAKFVDLPNCLAFGLSAYEAELRAQAALTTYAETTRAYGWAMPEPSIVKNARNFRDDYVAYLKLPPANVAAAA